MIKLYENYEIPEELRGEDVYDMFYLFENENEAVKYIKTNYNLDINIFIKDLHEDDFMREEFGKENYLRSAKVIDMIYLNELMNGNYILWEAY